MELAIKYCSDIKSQLGGYFGAWLPNVHVEIGEYGDLDNGVLTPSSRSYISVTMPEVGKYRKFT